VDKKELAEVAKSWMLEAYEFITCRMQTQLSVSEKGHRSDLVTNVDKEVQDFFVNKISARFPEDHILAEENGLDSIDNMQGRVWIIDPIDGTLNFIFQKENFAVMLGIYQDGVPQLGFIYEVVKNELYWGGSGMGAYCNERKLFPPQNLRASQGLWGMNAEMFAENTAGVRDLTEKSMGVRITGSAGLEFISLFKGSIIGYISSLYPWDYAPGMVIAEELGFKASFLDGTAVDFKGRNFFIVATKKAYEEAFKHLTAVRGVGN